MPTLTDEALDALIVSLDDYQEQRVRDAIELARDPEVAEQLLGELRKIITDHVDWSSMERISTATLALVLGQAGVPGVIPLLVDRLIAGEELEFISGVFEYVLARMGEPMFRHVMALIPDVTKPAARSELYWLLDASNRLSSSFQKEVADFCYERMPAELATPTDRSGMASWYSCCRVLITLGDERSRGFIEQGLRDPGRRKQQESWERLDISLRDYFGKPMQISEDCDYRIDWPELVPEWDGLFKGAQAPVDDLEMQEVMALIDTFTPQRRPETSSEVQDFTPELPVEPIEAGPKTGRNAPCPCGSGKKYKKCCGV